MSSVAPQSPVMLADEGARTTSVDSGATGLERVQAAKSLLVSWDMLMCIERSHKPRLRSTARRFLALHAHKTVLLSNDSTRLSCDVQAMLARHGIDLPEGRIHLAGQHTLEYLRQSAQDANVALIAETRLQNLAERLGIRSAGLEADMLVVMQDSRFDARKTALAATLVRKGVEVLVTDRAGGHIAGDGWVTPGPWSHLLACLVAADRLYHPVTVTGLPSTGMVSSALAQAGESSEDMVMIALRESPADMAAARLGLSTVELSQVQELDRLVGR